jgi:hypothetical protein
MNTEPEGNPKIGKKDKAISTPAILKDTAAHYIRMIGDADRKARIMIVVNSILLTISITLLTRALDHEKPVWISAGVLAVSNLVTLFFAIVSVRPEIRNNIGRDTENNMLHYKKCAEYSLSDYKIELLNALQTREQKLDALVKYLYFFGNLLNMKYKLIRISYRVFYWGMVLAIVTYLLIIMMNYSFKGVY